MKELSENNESIKKLMPNFINYNNKEIGGFGLLAAIALTVIGGLPLATALLSGLGSFNSGYNIKNVKKEKTDVKNINDLIVNIIIDLTNENDKKNAYNALKDNLKEYINIEDEKNNKIINKYASKIDEYINIPNEKIAYKKIDEYFKAIFNNQINSRIDKETISEISIMDLVFKFQNDKCIESKYDNDYDKNVYFIDNPFVLDKKYDKKYMTKYEYNLIKKILYNTEEVNTTEQILAEEKLEKIYNKLSEAVNGKIINKDNDFYLEEENFTEPISIHSLSAGLKSFAVIKMLIEKNALKEEDILILDEPEIHLHPKWQLLYAEIIVLLQKIFNVYVIVTTHSPYFLEAIEMYSKKHNLNEKTNYYLSDIENNYSVFNLVNNHIEKIYSKMVQPIDELEDLANMF
ncbi:ABC transporter ATP-binding protein, partial [Brachyspira hampsonii]